MIYWPSFWKGFMEALGHPITMGFVVGTAYGAMLAFMFWCFSRY